MTKFKEHSVSVMQLGISSEEITKYISEENSNIPDYFIDVATKKLSIIEKEKVRTGYKIFPVQINQEQLLIKSTAFHTGNEVARLLKGAGSVAVFACTVSEELNIKLSEFKKENITEAYIADITSNLIVEKSLSMLSEQLQIDSIKKGLKSTNTISPGNCDWPVEEQKKLFSLLPNSFLGISLNKYGMMNPVKSLSGIIGIGKSVKFKHTNCEQCASKNCLYRKAS